MSVPETLVAEIVGADNNGVLIATVIGIEESDKLTPYETGDADNGVLADVIAEAKRNGNYMECVTKSGHTIGVFARGGPGALEAANARFRRSVLQHYDEFQRTPDQTLHPSPL